MKLIFLGTRGEINNRTAEHKRHTSLLVSHKNKRIVIDKGTDWLNEEYGFKPDAILITHAHPDHAGGLRNNEPCKVYASGDTIRILKNLRSLDIVKIEEEKLFSFGDLSFTAFGVEHSLIAPAVGFKITAGTSSVFYSPDLIFIHNRKEALKNVKVYIGDGAAVSMSFIRKRGSKLIGHSKVQQQISWCAKEKVPKAIITHCGSEIVKNGDEKMKKKFREMGNIYGVDVQLAYDGMKILIR
jgi:phosphoribosyl 1,2-cyclic phosphodiesterase